MKNKIIFIILVFCCVFNIGTTNVFSEEFHDFTGKYSVSNSQIKQIQISQNEVTIFLDELNKNINPDDPLKKTIQKLNTYINNESRSNLTDPTKNIESNQTKSKIIYTKNINNKIKATNCIIFKDISKFILSKENKLILSINKDYLLSLSITENGDLADEINNVILEKIE